MGATHFSITHNGKKQGMHKTLYRELISKEEPNAPKRSPEYSAMPATCFAEAHSVKLGEVIEEKIP